ncbi:MAG: hypothetical protein GY765_20590 [bacterium]|nr:hypothetical protein [bacterium]
MKNITKLTICICLLFALTAAGCKNISQPIIDEPQPQYPTEPTIVIFEPPETTECFISTIFAIDGNTGFFSGMHKKLWSFSLITGEALDADGFELGHSSHAFPYIFPNHRLAIPCLYDKNSQTTYAESRTASETAMSPHSPALSKRRAPMPGSMPGSMAGVEHMERQAQPYFQWGIQVVDISNPADMTDLGIISFEKDLLRVQNIEVDDDGKTGYIAGSRYNKLYAFDITIPGIVAEESLPGSPDQIKKVDDNILIKSFPGGNIIVVDVSNPAEMRLKGTIDIPGGDFYSSQNIVTTADNKFGFVCKDSYIWSFDIDNLSLCDGDGLLAGEVPLALSIQDNTIVCCFASMGYAAERSIVFYDVSDPYNITEKFWGKFDHPAALVLGARVDFSADGQLAAVPYHLPDEAVYVFKTSTGELVKKIPIPGSRLGHLNVFGSRDILGVVKFSDYASGLDSRVYLLHNYMTAD